MREHISWAKQLKLENVGAYIVSETAKTLKCGSTYRGRNNENWKMRDHTLWAKQQRQENAGEHLVGE